MGFKRLFVLPGGGMCDGVGRQDLKSLDRGSVRRLVCGRVAREGG